MRDYKDIDFFLCNKYNKQRRNKRIFIKMLWTAK